MRRKGRRRGGRGRERENNMMETAGLNIYKKRMLRVKMICKVSACGEGGWGVGR